MTTTGPSPEAAVQPEPARDERRLTWTEADFARLAWPALALALLCTAIGLFYLTRGTTLWFDEWLWATGRRGGSVSSYLDSYNGHLSLVPLVIYKILFATAGLTHYAAYRAVVIVGHLGVVTLVYVYAKRRVGEFLGLLGAALILLFGPGWQNILWPFQIAWLVAVGTGIAALLMLDRRDRLGDVAACVLIAISLASQSVGLAVAAGVIVELAWGRRRWRDWWIVGVPLALYLAWSLGYQHTKLVGSVSAALGFTAQSAAVSLSSVLGLSGTNVLNSTGTLYTFGTPLAVAAVGLLIWLTHQRHPWTARALTLGAMLLAFWVLTAVGRADFGPQASRYLYVDAVFVVLFATELARGVVVRWRAGAILAVLGLAVVVSNLGVMRGAAGFLRAEAPLAKADLAALNLSGPYITPSYVATSFPGYPFIPVRAAEFLAAERDLGSPAYSVQQLATAPAEARHVADSETINLRGVTLRAAGPHPAAPAGPRPRVEGASAGFALPAGSCVTYAAGPAARGQTNALQLTVESTGLLIRASGAQASLGIRRFGDGFVPLGTLPAGTAGTVRITPDGAGAPWHLQATTIGRVQVCGLSA